MKSTQTADTNLQATLQSFMQSMPEGQGHAKKVKLTTINPETGQPMTVEMEQSTGGVVVGQTAVFEQAQASTAVAVAPQSILAQALPGGALIEKIIGGHISYLIIPLCGMIIAWSYNNMGGGHPALSVAMNFFMLSIVLELAAKFITFPVVEVSLDKKLESQRVRLKSKSWYKETLKNLGENLKAVHIKKALQWMGIALAFMACFIMLGYFLQGTARIVSHTPTGSPYSTNVTQSNFMVR